MLYVASQPILSLLFQTDLEERLKQVIERHGLTWNGEISLEGCRTELRMADFLIAARVNRCTQVGSARLPPYDNVHLSY